MSKILRVGNGDYKVLVKEGGSITLDTTDNALNKTGTVVVTGNLEVKGTTTTVDSTIVTIADNIIVLSKDNIAAGIPAALDFRSGIEIERGSLLNSRVVYDEQINWTMGGTAGTGTFTFEQGVTTVPVKAGGILNSGSIYLQPTGGVVSVTNTTNYEERVYFYDGGAVFDPGDGIVIRDDDHLPNAKGVADYITYILSQGAFQDRIEEGTYGDETYVETKDFSETGLESNVEIGVDGNAVGNFYSNRIDLFDVRISANRISSTASNQNLILSSPGTGTVQITDVLEMSKTPHADDVSTDPGTPADGIKVYSKTQAGGGTGLYFANESATADEIISRNRALIFSMIF